MTRDHTGSAPLDRYARQLALPEVGPEGQQRLERATVLVIGAGGLGCAVLPYLCAAGVGRLIVVDHDVVDESNLHRQPLYRTDDIGQRKAEVAWATLASLNPYVAVKAVCERLTPANAPALVDAADVIVDAADSFAVTYILSDECARARKPLVSADMPASSAETRRAIARYFPICRRRPERARPAVCSARQSA